MKFEKSTYNVTERPTKVSFSEKHQKLRQTNFNKIRPSVKTHQDFKREKKTSQVE